MPKWCILGWYVLTCSGVFALSYFPGLCPCPTYYWGTCGTVFWGSSYMVLNLREHPSLPLWPGIGWHRSSPRTFFSLLQPVHIHWQFVTSKAHLTWDLLEQSSGISLGKFKGQSSWADHMVIPPLDWASWGLCQGDLTWVLTDFFSCILEA